MKKIFLPILFLWAIFASSQVVKTSFWETDGKVNATLNINNKLYIGGDFSYVGPSSGCLAGISIANPSSTLLGFGLSGNVNSLLTDNSNRLIIGGDFSFNGLSKSLLVLNGSQPEALFNKNITGAVKCMAIYQNILYLGGNFSSIDGQTRNNLAAINLATGALTSWAPQPDGEVNTITISNGTIWVGGSFSLIGSQVRSSLASVTTSGTVNPFSMGINGIVKSIAVVDSLVYVGGSFNTAGSITRNNIASFNSFSNTLRNWNPNVDGPVLAMAISGSTLYIGGEFYSAGTSSRNNLAALNIQTGIATTFNPNVDAKVNCINLTGSTLSVGGTFMNVGTSEIKNFARISTSGSVSTNTPIVNSEVNAIGILGDSCLIGGSFSSIGGIKQRNLAILDINSGAAISWSVLVDGEVKAMERIGGNLVVAGSFFSVNQTQRQSIAIIDTIYGNPTSFDAGCQGIINTMHILGTQLFVGGAFSAIGGTSRNNLAALSLTTGIATTWNPDADAEVFDLKRNGSLLFAAGDFNNLGSTAIRKVASFNLANNASLRSWSYNFDSTVFALSFYNSGVFTGGLFEHVNSSSRNGLALIDTGNGGLQTWQSTGMQSIKNLAINSSLLFAGGSFDQNPNLIRAFSVANGNDIGVKLPGVSTEVNHLNIIGGNLFVGGIFNMPTTLGKQNFVAVDLSVDSPSIASNSFSYSKISPVSMRLHFKKGNGQNRIIIAREGSAVNTSPANGVYYFASKNYGQGQNLSGNYVVYNGSDTTVELTNLNINTPYYFAVYEYNGFGNYTRYLLNSKLIGNQSTISAYTTPTVSASNMSFARVGITSLTVKWSKGNGTNRLLVAHEGSAVNATPKDSSNYLGNANLGDGSDLGSQNFVVYNGSGDSILVTGLKKNTTYHFSIFELNGSDQFTKYKTSSPATGSQLTLNPATAPTTAASAINFSNLGTTSVTVGWTSGNGSSRIVIASEGKRLTTLPSDGILYFSDGNYNGSSSYLSNSERVVYVGTSNTVNVTGLTSNKGYYFSVIEYNGGNITSAYLTTSYPQDSVITKIPVQFPTKSSKGLKFNKTTNDSMSFSWTNGDGAKRILIMKEGGAVNAKPSIGKAYTANPVFGKGEVLSDGSYVISINAMDSITVGGLKKGTLYGVAIFEYNESFYGPAYLLDSFAFASQSTLSTGIAKITGDNHCRVYPNPFTGNKLSVVMDGSLEGNAILVISDLMGKTVYQSNISKTTQGEQLLEFEIGSLPIGQYLLQLSAVNQVYTTKLLVKE